MSKLVLFLLTYLDLHSFALSVLAHSCIWLWVVSISAKGSLPQIALSDASKIASTYFSLFKRRVHVLYTEIEFSTTLDSYFNSSIVTGIMDTTLPAVKRSNHYTIETTYSKRWHKIVGVPKLSVMHMTHGSMKITM